MAIGSFLRQKFRRSTSNASSISISSQDCSQSQSQPQNQNQHQHHNQNHNHTHGSRSTKSRRGSQTPSRRAPSTFGSATIDETAEKSDGTATSTRAEAKSLLENASGEQSSDLHSPSSKHISIPDTKAIEEADCADFPTPNTDTISPVAEEEVEDLDEITPDGNAQGTSATNTPKAKARPAELQRRQSLVPPQQTRLIKTLLETELPSVNRAATLDYFTSNGSSTISPNMVSRKIWVRRPGASATLVTINEDDLVDDVRDMILKKYANTLGRSFDSPDVTLRIIPRENQQQRTLGPEEPMGRTLDAYFPGGQTVEDALVIDVPPRRTPRPSPHTGRQYYEDGRPLESASEYFPPMAVPAPPSPHLPASIPVNGLANHNHSNLATHSMSVLTTGHVPALPSPGRRPHHPTTNRPRMGRQHTSSPTIISTHQQQTVMNNEKSSNPAPAAPPLPTPPAPLQAESSQIQRVATPPPRVSSPRPRTTNSRPKKKKTNADHPSLPAGMLNGAVPPINVLIVEDNIINLKLLEAFMKRLKVRWQTAMNGKEAVTKWRAGGFHLVLMDIQLPIMSGLEATKEIRRLERLNNIGVFSSSAGAGAEEGGEVEAEEDRLPSSVLFKSPVIIVALTASSLQSDRHEALAAGCNDFLTKPVNFVWLERKVMEWGCMQALIDFDGWRKWKDFSQMQQLESGEGGEEKKKADVKKKKGKSSRISTSGSGELMKVGEAREMGVV
ncbi:hypothetical protein HYALB_00008644 [Hymenoscyphus albidus]|uniref:Response regulatory domain-containing protein n=1 Tax=Hymenoscyphus albidus TaxID=595503 RepID=A0A9N9LI22_9HELO|nr:hypothetical protein HYALB_00008644 [Hymenoscyphus albidus]